MSSFRPGPVPPNLVVQRAVWPVFDTSRPYEPEPEEEPCLPPEPEPALEEAREEILKQARLEAAELLQQAAAEAEAAVEAARADGYAAGKEQGLVAAEQELQLQHKEAEWALERSRVQADAIRQAAEAEARVIRAEAETTAQALVADGRTQAEALLAQARAHRERLLQDSQESLIDLAVAAAIRLVQGHLALQPEAIVSMVRAGLRKLRDSDCTVRVSPKDLPLLEAQRSALERELGAGVLVLRPDRSFQQGDFTLLSPQGQVDATLEAQSAQIRAALTAALGGE